MTLTVATYNIAAGLSNGYFRKKNYHKSANVIKKINADIIALNEVGKHLPTDINEHTEFIAKHCGYEHYTFAKAAMFGKFPYGNSILSKYPIKDVEIFLLKKFVQLAPGIFEPRCILSTVISTKTQDMRVMCTHLGLLPIEQKLGIEKVIKSTAKTDMPIVFMGDLNINGNPKHILPLKQRLIDVCEQTDSKIFTFPAKNPKKRLDYIFISDNISLDRVYSLSEVASDHLPLVAEITL